MKYLPFLNKYTELLLFAKHRVKSGIADLKLEQVQRNPVLIELRVSDDHGDDGDGDNDDSDNGNDGDDGE